MHHISATKPHTIYIYIYTYILPPRPHYISSLFSMHLQTPTPLSIVLDSFTHPPFFSSTSSLLPPPLSPLLFIHTHQSRYHFFTLTYIQTHNTEDKEGTFHYFTSSSKVYTTYNVYSYIHVYINIYITCIYIYIIYNTYYTYIYIYGIHIRYKYVYNI